jgi:hypothetical protein
MLLAIHGANPGGFMRQTAFWLALGLGLAGCSHRALTQSDGGGKVIAPDVDGSTCETVYKAGPVQRFSCAGPNYSPDPVLTTSDGLIVYTDKRTLGSNSASDTDIFMLHPATGGTEQITGDDQETILYGVDGSSILYSREVNSYPKKRQLVLRLGKKTVFLGEHNLDYFDANLFAFGPARPVDGDQAAWRTKDAIHFFDGSQVRKVAALAQKAYHGSGPYLEGGALVWSAWDGEDLEVFLFKDGQTHKLTENSTPDRYPVVSNGRVYWSCEAGICSWAEGAVTVLDKGKCGPPDTHRGSAAWICDNRVTLYDGHAVKRITSGGDKNGRSAVRVHSGRLIWIEIRDPKQSPYQGQATLVFSDTRTQQDVAEVGLPCLACSAYWPPLSLSLSSGLFAWNYAAPLPSAKPPYDHCAYAEIQGRCAN